MAWALKGCGRAVAFAMVAGPVVAAAPDVPAGYVSMVGKYRFNVEASHYDVPLYSVDQTMTSTRDDPGGYTVGQSVVLRDGRKVDYTIVGKYDGKPYGQDNGYITFAFQRVGPARIQNDWASPDGKVGREYWQITSNRITINGRYQDKDGTAHPFTEVGDRIPS